MASYPIMLIVLRPQHWSCGASAGRMHAAVGRQGSSSKPVFHEGSVWSSYRLRGVLSEAWSRGCAGFRQLSNLHWNVRAQLKQGLSGLLMFMPAAFWRLPACVDRLRDDTTV